MGSRRMRGRFVERLEPRKTSLYTSKRVCSGNNGGVIEMGSRPRRPKVGVCNQKRKIEVEDNLVEREKIKVCG